MTIIEILAIAAAVAVINQVPLKVVKSIKELREERSYKKARARIDEIAEIRKKAGLKELLNSSMASAMKHRQHQDAERAAGRTPLSYDEYFGYTDSKTCIEPSIRARLKELGGLRG